MHPTVREITTDALRYWERLRLVYNAVLGAIVVLVFLGCYPLAKQLLAPGAFLGLLVLALLANVCYTLAYVPDVFVQLSVFRESWRRFRWLLFVAGMVFAGWLAFVISLEVFGSVAAS